MLKLAALLILSLAAFAQTRPGLDGFDAFAGKALQDFDVPGVAIAIVHNDQVILSKGYGLRNVARNLPVTPKTLFAIGSSTKSFTVVSMGLLADQGKLDWDKPVREYLPNFRLQDQFATDRMTPRDLVTHRSGLPRHDLMWYNSPFSRKEIYDRLRYLEPSHDFRTTFQYQNLMFMTAGYLAGQIADMPWESVVRERIFKPLGMSSSNFSITESQKGGDFAMPYSKVKETVKEIPFRNIDEIGPAGSINSNVEDMLRYVRMHLTKGKLDGKQFLSESNVVQMQTPQMVIPGTLRYTETGHQSYGMGFFITTYRGHKVVHHGGNIDGFTALVSFAPQDNLGIVILTNMNGSPLPTVLSYNIYDRLFGLDAVDWTSRIKDDEKKAKQSADEAKQRGLTAQRPNTHPSHELKDYAGTYEHPAYGIVKISLAGDHLTAAFNNFTGDLKHFHYDVFEVAETEGNPLSKSKFQFASNLQGDVDRVLAPIESSVKEIVFARKADAAMSDRAFLQAFAGDYTLGNTPVAVTLQGDRLVLTLPGQPPYELQGVSGTRFNVKGLTGYAVDFRKDSSGSASEMVFLQPNGVFVAKRK